MLPRDYRPFSIRTTRNTTHAHSQQLRSVKDKIRWLGFTRYTTRDATQFRNVWARQMYSPFPCFAPQLNRVRVSKWCRGAVQTLCCASRSSCLLRRSTRSFRLAHSVASRRARRARARCSRRRTCSPSGARRSARRACCASSTCAPPSWERSRSRRARAVALERRTQ